MNDSIIKYQLKLVDAALIKAVNGYRMSGSVTPWMAELHEAVKALKAAFEYHLSVYHEKEEKDE